MLDGIISDVYTATGFDDRYTFVGGSTSGGLVVYDDKFAFSHHATDPASGKLCNAFDLVRLHLFTPGKDNAEGMYIHDDARSAADWQEGLELDKQGKVKDTLGNIALILRRDPKLGL